MAYPDGLPTCAPSAPSRARLGLALVAVFLIATIAAIGGLDVRSSVGGKASVDEPQYLLSAESLIEDGNLDISDELAAETWRAYHDRTLPVQTEVLDDGRQISPHDPLLPLYLAVPYGIGGFTAAKIAMALLAGAAAAGTLWVAVRRFAVDLGLAAAGVALGFTSPPLAVYAQQIYPELPAALATVVAVGALTGRLGGRGLTVLVLAVIALPWLSVKYAPVAAVLAVVATARLLRRRRWRAAATVGAVLAAAGVVYLGVHQAIWGGWTVYASGDHFQDDGEFAVVGTQADYWGRSQRLAALLLDRDYGLAAWQPGWLLIIPALGALAATRARRACPLAVPALVLPAAAGWLVASFVALTMNGYWFPGRQVVVILPLVLLLILLWVQSAPRLVGVAAVALAWIGVLTQATLLVRGSNADISWINVPRERNLDEPLHDGLATLLPEYRVPDNDGLWLMHGIWLAVFAALAVAAWLWARRSPSPSPAPQHEAAR